MNDAQILTLVDRLERCLLAKDDFHHRDHLAVAVVYLYAAAFESALDRMRVSLTRFAAHHGVRGLYHETLTRFWMQQVEQRLDRALCLQESVRNVQQALPDKKLALKYYSQEKLDSAEAKASWVEPEL
jgi:hypothetical protein